MKNVIDLWEYKRARLGGKERPPICRRARRSGSAGFVRIGDVTSAVVLRLRK